MSEEAQAHQASICSYHHGPGRAMPHRSGFREVEEASSSTVLARCLNAENGNDPPDA